MRHDPSGPEVSQPSPAAARCLLRVTDVPAGLVLGVDEYLTALVHELAMVRLDDRPSPAAAAVDAGSLAIVGEVMASCARNRQAVRELAERAYDAGRDTLDLELAVPVEASVAASGLRRALGEIRQLSNDGRLLLPPLSDEAAAFLSEFLALAARQIEEQALSGAAHPQSAAAAVSVELTTSPEGLGAPEAPSALEDRRTEHLATSPRLEREERHQRRAFPRGLSSAAQARHFVVETLESWNLAGCAARAELPTAELVANALLYSTKEIAVVVKADGRHVLVEVHDCAPAHPAVRRRGDEADSGRGLILVDALADRWGYDTSSDLTKRVWFELTLSPG